MCHKTTQIVVMLLCIALTACDNQSTADQASTQSTQVESSRNQLSQDEIKQGWQLLFDGRSLDQWKAYGREDFPDKAWKIEKGLLVVEQSGQEMGSLGIDIITKEKYENFELRFDFMTSDSANSGVFYKVLEEADAPIWANAPEYQIMDNAFYLKKVEDGFLEMDMRNHLTGDAYGIFGAEKDYSNSPGIWNTARILVNNDEVKHWLNGQLVVSYVIGSSEWKKKVASSKFSSFSNYGLVKKGHIGLQDHGHLVKFRNLKIKEIK